VSPEELGRKLDSVDGKLSELISKHTALEARLDEQHKSDTRTLQEHHCVLFGNGVPGTGVTSRLQSVEENCDAQCRTVLAAVDKKLEPVLQHKGDAKHKDPFLVRSCKQALPYIISAAALAIGSWLLSMWRANPNP
jgi:hypothetical protein